MNGLQLGMAVMMQLGSYQFSIATAAYQELVRRSEWRWPSQDRFGRQPQLQYTGPGTETITLTGTIITEWRGGIGQLDDMRSLASTGQPQSLVDGYGNLMGRWVIENIEEKQSAFAAFGRPRKQEFTLSLRKYPDAEPGAANELTAGAASASGQAAATAAAAGEKAEKGAIAKFVEGASAKAATAISTMNSALQAVQSKAAEIGNAVGPVIATVQHGISTATELRNSVLSVKGSLGNLSSLGNIQSALYGVTSAASAAANAGAVAAGAAKAVGIQLPSIPNVSLPAIGAIKDCQAACGRMAVTATGIYGDADKLAKSITRLGR